MGGLALLFFQVSSVISVTVTLIMESLSLSESFHICFLCVLVKELFYF